MTHILITGAAGHIGRKVRAYLTVAGHKLTGLDIHAGDDPSIIPCDLSVWNPDWVQKFAGVDAVIHLAGCPRPDAGWAEIQPLNLDMTMNVLEAAAQNNVKRVIFASSNWVLAGRRWDDVPLASDTEPCPLNPYGASKLAGERMGYGYNQARGLSFIVLRIGYAPLKPSPQPGPHMAWGPWGQRMWLSDRDLCAGIEAAVLAPDDVKFAVVNLVSDNEDMRWDLEEAKRSIGYRPADHGVPVISPEMEARDEQARAIRSEITHLEAQLMADRW